MHSECCILSSLASTAVLIAAASPPLGAQVIRVGENVAVTSGGDRRPPVEAHLAVHPTNPRHLLGAAITTVVVDDWREMRAHQTCSAFLSRDAGQTWHAHEFMPKGCLDPWVTMTGNGQAVFTAFGARGELFVYHSADSGVTWDPQFVTLGTGHDHPTTVAGGNSPQRSEWLYLLSNHAGMPLYRSKDAGRTFGSPIFVRSNTPGNAEMPAVLADGTLVLSYVEVRDSSGSELPQRRAWVVRSSDGGETFSRPALVNTVCGPPYRLSMLAADTSASPFHNRLYFACNLPGETGVVLNHSIASSDQWSEVVRVHSAPVDTTIRRKVMALAVGRRGIVGVAWVDARHASPNADCYDIYFTASLDGGDTFLPEERVSTSTSCPQASVNGAIGRIFAPSGGDYLGMVADADGRFRLLWSDARNGPFQLWTASIEVTGEVAPR